jgi:hypothetical protein
MIKKVIYILCFVMMLVSFSAGAISDSHVIGHNIHQ